MTEVQLYVIASASNCALGTGEPLTISFDVDTLYVSIGKRFDMKVKRGQVLPELQEQLNIMWNL